MIQEGKMAKVLPGKRLETIAPVTATTKSPLSRTYRDGVERTHYVREAVCAEASFQEISPVKTAICPTAPPVDITPHQTTYHTEKQVQPRQETPKSAHRNMTLGHLFAQDKLAAQFKH